jgi:hypothetical protein
MRPVASRRILPERPARVKLASLAAGGAIGRAIETALEPGSDAPHTPDIGGKITADLGKAIAAAL